MVFEREKEHCDYRNSGAKHKDQENKTPKQSKPINTD
jgi:hypothetical protein